MFRFRSSAGHSAIRAVRGTAAASVVRCALVFAVALQVSGAGAAVPDRLPFEERLKLARAAEVSPAMKGYFQELGKAIEPYLRGGVQNCLSKLKEPDLTTFIIVADVTVTGGSSKIEVRPHTNMSDCFARSFEFVKLPKLAPHTKEPTLPIFFEIRLK